MEHMVCGCGARYNPSAVARCPICQRRRGRVTLLAPMPMSAPKHQGRPRINIAIWPAEDAQKLAWRFAEGVPWQDRRDVAQAIILRWLSKAPKGKAMAYGIARWAVKDYWRIVYEKGKAHGSREGVKVESLDAPIASDGEGNVKTLADTLAYSWGGAQKGIGRSIRLPDELKRIVRKKLSGHANRITAEEKAKLERWARRWLKRHPSYAKVWGIAV